MVTWNWLPATIITDSDYYISGAQLLQLEVFAPE